MKFCQHSGCSNPVFSHRFCSWHQRERTDKAYLTSLEKRTAKNKQKMKDSIKKAYNPVPRVPTGELALFRSIWATRPHISFISGREIEFFHPIHFAHVLPKGKNKYPLFKLYDKNVVILTEREHTLYDQGTMQSRAQYSEECLDEGFVCDWQKLFTLRDELKKEYEKL